MKSLKQVIIALSIILISIPTLIINAKTPPKADEGKEQTPFSIGDTIFLPQPKLDGNMTVDKVIANRRSDAVISFQKLSKLLWAGQGITDKRHHYRSTPSAGAKYPLEIFVFVGNVEDLPIGLYKYIPKGHKLVVLANYDRRRALARSIPPNKVDRILEPPVVLVIGANFKRTESKYGTRRGPHYVYIEAGACAENIALEAEDLYLSTFIWGAFDDNFVYKACRMEDEQPIIIMPIGYKKNP